MIGLEHYQRAEWLVQSANAEISGATEEHGDYSREHLRAAQSAAVTIAQAQVHATLALAAAAAGERVR